MTEGFADWLAAEWPVLLPEIAVAQPLHVRRWSEALSEGAFGDFAAPRAIYGRYLARRSSERLAKLVEDGVQVQLITGWPPICHGQMTSSGSHLPVAR